MALLSSCGQSDELTSHRLKASLGCIASGGSAGSVPPGISGKSDSLVRARPCTRVDQIASTGPLLR